MFKSPRYFIIIIFLALLGLVIYPVGVMPIKGIVWQITTPISQSFYDFTKGAKIFFTNLRQISTITQTNQQLKEENLRLQSANIQCAEINHQNQILKEELGFLQEQGQKELIPAAIIGRSPSGFVQVLRTNKGSSDGVKEGQPVISHGYLVGVVWEVFSNNSEVFLITNSRSLISVILQESRGTGLLKGGLEGLIVKEIPVDTQIKIGEQVLTSGLGGDLPAGIPLGQVKKIISKKSEIFQQISIDSPIEIGKLEVVFIYK